MGVMSRSVEAADQQLAATAGKEVRSKTHAYYQVLIDARDCPFIVSSLQD